jgi:hypothetical protein
MDKADTLNVVFNYIPGYWLLLNVCFNNGGVACVLDRDGGDCGVSNITCRYAPANPALAGARDNRMTLARPCGNLMSRNARIIYGPIR